MYMTNKSYASKWIMISGAFGKPLRVEYARQASGVNDIKSKRSVARQENATVPHGSVNP